MTVTAGVDDEVVDPPRPDPGRRRQWSAALAAALVAVVAAPVVVAGTALVGDPWLPLSDWASMAYRVSAVGGGDTPLVGPYSFHEFAHPGPLLYWVSAPLFRLTGGDPRSLLWSGAAVNVAAVAAIGAAGWRRGRWPLLLALMLLVTGLLHGFGPAVLANMWNPYVPLLPFLLAVVLVWDAALGRSGSLVWAAVPASFALQAHLAFVPLVGAVVLWYLVWTRGRRPPGAGRSLRVAAVVTAGLWIGPLLDALVDQHNPFRVARSLTRTPETVGPLDALAVVGGYVRLDGRWLRGSDAVLWLSPRAVDAVHLVVAVAVLVACLVVARRRRLTDVAALASLTLVLLAVSVPATSRLVQPTMPYLAEWLKLVGGLVWLTVGWTAWRLAEPAVRATPGRRAAAVAVAVSVLVAGSAAGVDRAAGHDPQHGAEPATIATLREGWRDAVDPGATVRVETVGDPFAHWSGLTYWMIEDGLDVVTADGAAGLKWGRTHQWEADDAIDETLTVAVRLPGADGDELDGCRTDDQVEEVATWHGLTPAERSEIEDLRWRRLTDSGGLSEGEAGRAASLGARDVELALFAGTRLCGQD